MSEAVTVSRRTFGDVRICSYAARDALVGGSSPLLTSTSEQQAPVFLYLEELMRAVVRVLSTLLAY